MSTNTTQRKKALKEQNRNPRIHRHNYRSGMEIYLTIYHYICFSLPYHLGGEARFETSLDHRVSCLFKLDNETLCKIKEKQNETNKMTLRIERNIFTPLKRT